MKSVLFDTFLVIGQVMGLDLYCGDVHARMGSYSTVHAHRLVWLRAEVALLRSLGRHEDARDLSECLGREGIHYQKLMRRSSVLQEGTRLFVLHSDCEGTWSPAEACSILRAIENLRLGEEEHFLEPILRASVTTRTEIQFC